VQRSPWRDHREVDLRAAHSALVARGLARADDPVAEIGRGWDNAVFAVGARLLRISVREVGDPLMAKEIVLLPRLRHHLPLNIPTPIASGPPGPGLPGPWMVYAPLPGAELTAHMASGGRLADARALGELLRVLHSPALAEAWRPHLPRDPNQRTHPDALVPRAHAALDQAICARLPVPSHALRRLIDGARGAKAGPDVLCHGDLHLRHLLVDVHGRPTGVIDWGDACLAPASMDLGVVFGALDAAARGPFWRAYGGVDDGTVALARLFAAYSNLMLMLSTHDDGPRSVFDAARAALRHTLQ